MAAPAARYLCRLAALLCLAGCGGSARGGRPAVASVEITGNRAIDDDTLEEGLATREPTWYSRKRVAFDRRDVADDKERIERQYRERGYFQAAVTEVITERGNGGADPGEVEVEFRIDEGEPVLVTDVRFDGAPEGPDVDAKALARVAGIAKGRPLDHPAYLEAKEKLLAHLLSRGFAHAEVRGAVRVVPSDLRAVVVFDIDAGPRVRLGPLEVQGLVGVPRSAVENRLAWAEGDPYRPDKLATTRARLRTLGFFSTVRVAVEDQGRKARPPVAVAVVEAPRNTVRLGAGFAVDRVQWGFRGVAGYSRLGALGPLTKLKTEVRPGYVVLREEDEREPVIEARLSVEKDDFVVPLVNGLVGADYSIRQIEAYRSEGPTFRGKLSRTFADGFLYLGFAYQFQALELTDINPAISDDLRPELGLEPRPRPGRNSPDAALPADVTRYNLAFLEQTLAIDGRDDSVRPRLGYYGAVKLQQAAASLGSEFSFAAGAAELRGFAPAGDRVVFAALARWSQMVAGDRLPISRRYFGGGATSHRGFSQRRLSPVASQRLSPDRPGEPPPGEPPLADPYQSPPLDPLRRTRLVSVAIGGEAMFEGSLEARFDVATLAGQTLGLVAFADVGDVTFDAGDLDPFDVHVAVGGGLRLYTPIGPLRVDLGYRLNRYGSTEPDPYDRLAFHITLGEAF